jgi:hypothetical protein
MQWLTLSRKAEALEGVLASGKKRKGLGIQQSLNVYPQLYRYDIVKSNEQSVHVFDMYFYCCTGHSRDA